MALQPGWLPLVARDGMLSRRVGWSLLLIPAGSSRGVWSERPFRSSNLSPVQVR
jgi:hypothetical protein